MTDAQLTKDLTLVFDITCGSKCPNSHKEKPAVERVKSVYRQYIKELIGEEEKVLEFSGVNHGAFERNLLRKQMKLRLGV